MVDECHRLLFATGLVYYWTKCSKRTVTQQEALYHVYTDFALDIRNFGCIEYFCC